MSRRPDRGRSGPCRNTRRAAWFAAALVAGTGPVRAYEATYRAGAHGWSLEGFGPDGTVLRAPTAAGPSASREVGLLFSCSGPDRRVRLSFPRPVAGPPGRPAAGAVLLAPLDAPRNASGDAVAARFAGPDPATVVLAETASPRRDIARALGRMVLAGSRGLGLIVSVGTKPIALTHLMFYQVLLTLGSEDAAAVRSFVDACHPPDRPPG